jgi:Maltokinase N-terminal cap domain
MAIIHDTTLSPGKLELLADWLPAQPWYGGGGREPALSKAGGFRLDDPRARLLVALIQGQAQPQAQSLSNTPDPHGDEVRDDRAITCLGARSCSCASADSMSDGIRKW